MGFLPGTGRCQGAALTEGGFHISLPVWKSPSTSLRLVPHPRAGEDQSAMGVTVSILNGALRTGTPVSGWPEPTETR